MKDILRDLVRGVNGFGFDVIKVTAAEETTFEAVNNDRTVIMKAKTKDPITSVQGTFGLASLSILQGILGLSAMKDDDADVEVKLNASGEPEELVFKGKGNRSVYRLMAERTIPKQPNFRNPGFDVEVEPTKASFVDFKEQAGVFGSVGTTFKPSTRAEQLHFALGDASSANHCSDFAFADAAGQLTAAYGYPIAQTITALGLINTGDVKVSFSAKGVMQIDVDTGMTEFSFIFPGHS